ncbi:hypothetical protein EB796_012847 [Bugula neritina]|uniref:Uncharacterized protein n=1 Tax=Bugula neritina TaxID=10212 RepID=A0A7J7JR77_BUGNE|nr:hypothetical protein EB796_012847 [Bugula neritina]
MIVHHCKHLHNPSCFSSRKRKLPTSAIFMNLLVNKQPSRFRSQCSQASIHRNKLFSLKRQRHKTSSWLSSMSTEATQMCSIDTRCPNL